MIIIAILWEVRLAYADSDIHIHSLSFIWSLNETGLNRQILHHFMLTGNWHVDIRDYWPEKEPQLWWKSFDLVLKVKKPDRCTQCTSHVSGNELQGQRVSEKAPLALLKAWVSGQLKKNCTYWNKADVIGTKRY